MINTGILPGYQANFAREAAQAANPHAWRRLRGYWDPTLGYQGAQLFDQSGFGHDAVHTNMAGVANWIPGPDGRCIDMSRNDDDMLVGDRYVFDDLRAFTWCIKVKFDAVAADGVLVARGALDGTSPFQMWMDQAVADHIGMVVNDAGGGSGVQLSALVPTTGVWYDLCWTFKADTEMRLYINGAEDANSPFATAAIGTIKNAGVGNNNVRFGNDRDPGTTKGLEGQLSRIAFYDRTLSQAEALEHYTNPHLITQLRRAA